MAVYSWGLCALATTAGAAAVRGRLAGASRQLQGVHRLDGFKFGFLIRIGPRARAVGWRPVSRLATESVSSSSSVLRERGVESSDAERRTVYALSTATGKAGIAVFRVSGPAALDVWRRVVRPIRTRREDTRLETPRPWRVERCAVVDPDTDDVLDYGLSVFFKGPKSFTTEDVLELHTHSGRALVAAVLSALARVPFCRPAEPGEFTRRAFEGGRLDLTQVEGLKDLIEADTEAQRKLALRVAGGASREVLNALRTDIIQSLALVEAVIDFGENDSLEDDVLESARTKVLALCTTIQTFLSDHRKGEIIRSGIRLAIFGPPNAGKSSLLNFLAKREAAIVTPVPGTTRDVLELSLDIGGLPVIVADTAGLRQYHDVVEGIGIERAKTAIQGADISLCVLSLPDLFKNGNQVPPIIQPFISSRTLVLLNKSDLMDSSGPRNIDFGERSWTVSLHTGEGVTEFMTGFAKVIQDRFDLCDEKGLLMEAPIITHARHRVHLETASRHLEAFLDILEDDVVLAAEELRYAAAAVGKISGAIGVEDVLDVIFRDFCIGK